jgi:ABC-2 type transport system ATP-binding protein
MTAVKTVGLTKRYGAKTAVDGLNLSVGEGELYSLLGVNGAGKTTTIRMLTTLSAPTSGEAFILGHNCVTERAAVKQLVGISPQDTAVAENLTVEENLAFMETVYGIEGARREELTKEIRSLFSLDEVWNSRAKTLSGGWKRKLSIAMALIGEPKVLFLDEPTLGLDVLARRELWKAVESLKGRITIVLTTHYMEEAEALSDRIAVMLAGRLAAEGTLAEIEERTGAKGLENAFVALAGEGRDLHA